MLRQLLFVSVAFFALALNAQTPSKSESVLLSAVVQPAPARITLNWSSHPNSSSFTIYRRTVGTTSWGSAVASLGGSALTWADNSVSPGTAYEYKVVRSAATGTAYGYMSSGIEVAPVDYRGTMILLVASNIATPLATQLQQLELDLKADGWSVIRHDVSTTASVTSVRAMVQADHAADPTNVKALYIIGHVPVPYSGDLEPDGHSYHRGAYPCDGYYAELNGTWTDNSVYSTGSANPKNHNTPGDGKFDQSDFPSALELQVGRLDLSDMPAFSQTEVQLLTDYLNKAHNFKVKQWVPQVRGIMFDNLQGLPYPMAATGWRSMAPLVGASNITEPAPQGPAFSTYINNQSYLWTYSSGGGLVNYPNNVMCYHGADNVATTEQLATSVFMGGVFNMSFGSYFGDWDNRNNYLRAQIASGNGLSSVWAAIPNWWFHHMGMGGTIGASAQASMNNTSSNYAPVHGGWQSTIGRAHLNLMGDPSLRMTMVAPPSGLQIANSGGTAAFSWVASADAVQGYYLYQIDATSGVITRIVPSLITGTTFQSPTVPFVAGAQYMVRAAKVETTQSGSYYNLSLGAIGTASGAPSNDCLGVPGGSALPGTACNDNNANTGNDTWNVNCQCVGQVIDCQGAPGGSALPGSACNDNNANTANDTWNSSCQCVGQLLDCQGTPGGSVLPGTACNDNNPNTANDTWNSSCQCVGQVIDCLGVAGGPALPGTSCNDGNATTINDAWNSSCQCVGQYLDCNGTPNGPAVPNSPCDDGNANTGNDTWNANCQCIGQVIDCQGTPGGSALPGTSCNDGNANTINDVWSANCQCAGTPVTFDCLGVANGPALPGTSCNDNNANTGNDTWNANCQCVGQVIDCQGTPGGSALPGTSCNDGNANTINDVWSANCQCAGTPVTFDCLGVANGTALPGTSCNDNNANTGNDTWNANCQCIGQVIDCQGTPGGSALPGTSCNDGNANTINDVWSANCQCAGTPVTFDCLGCVERELSVRWNSGHLRLLGRSERNGTCPAPRATTTTRTPATIPGTRTASASVK